MSILVGIIANKLLALLKQELKDSEPEIKVMLMAEFEKILKHLEQLAGNAVEKKLSEILPETMGKDASTINNV